MLSWVLALFLLGTFIYLLTLFRVVTVSREVMALSRQVLATLNSRELSDLEKEKAMQAFSLRLFKSFLLIIVGSGLALLIPVAVIWALDHLQWVSLQAVVTTSLSWPFLLVSLVVGCAAFYLMRQRVR
ncbi:MAG: hypothetical protein VYA55_20785 [Pseudomonadota bacterium]|nr:hypothetical protein [Pseudomonadota bacterium]